MLTKYILVVPPNSTVYVVPRLSIRTKRTICQVLTAVFGLLAVYLIAGVVNGVLPVFGGLIAFVASGVGFAVCGAKGGCFK